MESNRTEQTMINEGKVIDIYIVYQFIKRLATPFSRTQAFKHGLIDDEGVLLKKRKDMTSKEKNYVTHFDLMVFNLKRLINKLPGGESKIKSFAVALLLLKESIDANEVDIRNVALLSEELEYSSEESMKSYKEFVSETMSTTSGASSDSSLTSYSSGTFKVTDMMSPSVECSKFGKCQVFHVSDDTFNNVKNVKGRYDKFMSTVGKGPVRDAISAYAKTNPSKSIMLKNKTYGNYTMLKLGSKQKW